MRILLAKLLLSAVQVKGFYSWKIVVIDMILYIYGEHFHEMRSFRIGTS